MELYSRLPVRDEPDIIAAAVPAGARILELGSGVGRVTPLCWSAGWYVQYEGDAAARRCSPTA